MPTIKGRLSRLKELGLMKASEFEAGTQNPRSKPSRPIAAEDRGDGGFLPGWDWIAPHGFTRTVETGLSLGGASDGRFDASHFANAALRRKKGLDPLPDEELPYGSLSFFDLETTGLSGGTGTIAFLAAIGFFEGGDFLITQVFIDDFPGEPSFLDFTVNLLAERPRLVTYNGAAFDLPLLRTRCVMNAVHLPDFTHIDALHISRRFWRRTLGSCSLQALEAGLLGEPREDDVPGFLIPRLWLEYSGSAGAMGGDSLEAMEKVVGHNLRDVRSLAKLFMRIEGIMAEPEKRWAEERVHAPRLAFELIAAGRREEGIGVLEEAGSRGDGAALRCLARLYRKAGEEEACGRIVALMKGRSVEDCVEMAKYHEHLEKDWAAALRCTEKAIELLGRDFRGGDIAEALERRSIRLERKLGKQD